MSIPRVKVWKAGEVVTDDDLNAEFNNILLNPLYADSTGAASIGFIQSGTGAPHASATTVQTKLRNGVPVDVVSDYGADPSAVSDSTTAIQNAITDAAVLGGVVFFPVGTYKITSTLTVPLLSNVSVRLVGADQRSVILSFVGMSGIGLRWGSATRDPSGTTTNNTLYGAVENMTLNAASSSTTMTVFQANQPQFFSMERVLIQGANGAGGIGMRLNGSTTTGLGAAASPHAWRGTYRKVWVTDCRSPLILDNADENEFYSCIFEITKSITASANTLFGIEIKQGLNNRFFGTLIDGDTNGTYKGAYVGLMIDQPVNGAIQNNQFYGLVCEGFSRGIWIAGTVGGAMPLSTTVRGYYSSINTTSYLNVQDPTVSGYPAGNYSIIEEVTNQDMTALVAAVFTNLTVAGPFAQLGYHPTTDGGGGLLMILSNTNKNWSIQFNQNVAGALEFTQSTAGGGSTFGSPAMYLDSSGNLVQKNAVTAFSATAIPAGGTAGKGFLVSSTSNFGVFFGSGAPTLSAAKGSLYLRSDGSGTTDRAYINTNGSTTWTALTTVA